MQWPRSVGPLGTLFIYFTAEPLLLHLKNSFNVLFTVIENEYSSEVVFDALNTNDGIVNTLGCTKIHLWLCGNVYVESMLIDIRLT